MFFCTVGALVVGAFWRVWSVCPILPGLHWLWNSQHSQIEEYGASVDNIGNMDNMANMDNMNIMDNMANMDNMDNMDIIENMGTI